MRRCDITVLVKDVKARKLPAVDDEFAKTASEFDTIQRLGDHFLRERLTQVKEREADAALLTPVLQATIPKVDVIFPESLVGPGEVDLPGTVMLASRPSGWVWVSGRCWSSRAGTRPVCVRIRASARPVRSSYRASLRRHRPQRFPGGHGGGKWRRDRPLG